MFECIKFIFKIVTDFIKMLFTIDIGNNMSLGTLMCVIFIFLPLLLTIFNLLKRVVFDEFDDKYDSNNILYGRKGRYKGKHEYKPKHAKKK